MKITLIRKDGFIYLKGKMPTYVLSFIRAKVSSDNKVFDSINHMYGLRESYFSSIRDSLLRDFSEVIESNASIDYYKELHILPSAPMEVVKASYKALCLLYHPDRSSQYEEKMIKINEAYKKIIESY